MVTATLALDCNYPPPTHTHTTTNTQSNLSSHLAPQWFLLCCYFQDFIFLSIIPPVFSSGREPAAQVNSHLGRNWGSHEMSISQFEGEVN